VAAIGGGTYFLMKSAALARDPSRRTAMANFHASLLQLTLLLSAAIIDAVLLH
jgi:heme o synthase